MPAAAAKPALAPEETAGIFRTPAQRRLVACLVLALATLVLYSGVARNGLLNYDDDRYVLTNSHVKAGLNWTTAKWAFRTLNFANWHPLTWLSYALDYKLFQLNPAGYHCTNLLLHMVNAVLLFLLLERATRSLNSRSIGRSLMVAALFAVHPINVESVAWIAERKNVLAMLFCLLTLAAYGWYARRPGVGRYLLVMLLFAMGLMSKPMAIMLPFALLLLDYWPLGRLGIDSAAVGDVPDAESGRNRFSQVCLEKVPLLVLSAGSAVVTVVAQKAEGAVASSITHPFLLRLENAIVCYVLYIAKAFWPARLAVLYPYPRSLPTQEVLASALFLLIVTGAVVKYREHRSLLVGWFWYLGTMAPMIGLLQVGNQAMADRYAYLPFLGLFVMVVWGLADWVESGRRANSAVAEKILAVAGIVAIVALAAVTFVQVSYWHDDLSLWTHTLSVTPANFVAENNMGAILARQGRYEEAVAHFRTANALEPGDSVSQLNLGIYAQQQGDLTQAVARYEMTLRLATDRQIRVSAYANLGQIDYALGNYERAREEYEYAAKLGKLLAQ